jgi:hypothetical protein
MKWTKIVKSDRIPQKEFIVTDGKSIDIKINSYPTRKFVRGLFEPEDSTHYILLDDIKLPMTPCKWNAQLKEPGCDGNSMFKVQCSGKCGTKRHELEKELKQEEENNAIQQELDDYKNKYVRGG